MKNKRALVVDDEFLIRYAVSKTLEGLGMEVTKAEDAEQALVEIGNGVYDICFLDHCLPGLSGIGAMPLIQQRSPHTKIVIMTAATLSPQERAVVEASADSFMKKPFELSQIKEIVEEIFRSPPRIRS